MYSVAIPKNSSCTPLKKNSEISKVGTPDWVLVLLLRIKLTKLNNDINTAVSDMANPEINITLGNSNDVEIKPLTAELKSVKKLSLDLPRSLLTFV